MAADLGGRALLTLAPVSAMAGIISALVVQWSTDAGKVRRATNLMLAHVLEFRLFLDEPTIVLRAQRDLLRANVRLLRLLILPCVILAIPFALLFGQLNALYGHAPLWVGSAAVVTGKAPVLNMPPGIAVETPGVHSKGEVSWRIRPYAAIPVRLLRQSNPGVEIPFPLATILHLHWVVWFLLISGAATVGMRWLL
jgi:hypothetical protein